MRHEIHEPMLGVGPGGSGNCCETDRRLGSLEDEGCDALDMRAEPEFEVLEEADDEQGDGEPLLPSERWARPTARS